MRFEEQARGMRPDRSVLLTASAGSGKTFVLVGRILHLLASGAAPESLAAITFTEKAAAQMKDRLFGRLAEASWEGVGVRDALGLLPEDMPYPLKVTPEEAFSALVADPDALRISTIHAFCLGLLRRFPIEAGLPAEFGLLDETESAVRKERAAGRAIEFAAEDGGVYGRAFGTLLDAGVGVNDISALLAGAMGRRGLLAMAAARAGELEGLLSSIESGMKPDDKERAVREAIEGGEVAESAGRLLAMLDGIGVELPGYTSALGRLSGLRALDGFPDTFERSAGAFYTKKMMFLAKTPLSLDAAKKSARRIETSLKGDALKARAAELKSEHDALYTELRERVNFLAALHDDFTGSRALMALLRLYGIAERSYCSGNHRDGFVDFDDLEIHAYRLLSGPDGHRVLQGLGQKTLHCLVDEFQDTNLLQWAIIERLNAEVFAGQGAEGIAAPTLFAVGDTKQSIYRFRDADYRLMDKLREKMEARIGPDRMETPALDYNFRSAPEVLKVVDETFGVLMDGYRGSKAVRAEAKGGVSLRVVEKEDEPAALAGEIINALGMPVWDGAGGLRPAGYGDMAVLLRTRAGLGAYEAAFRARGIPFKVVGGVGFFRQPEVRALLGVLGWLENPGGLLHLASALKSPLFRLSDGEIEPLYRSDDPMAALAEISPEAHRLFSAWRDKAGLVPAGSLVSDIVKDSSALLAFGASGGPASALNIEKLVALAHAFDRRGAAGLSGFMEWVGTCRDKSDLPTADVELPGFERFVSVMTVHAAKGLEFPIVFIPGAARGTSNSVPGFLAGAGEGGGLEMAVKTDALLGDNPHYSRLKESEKAEEAREAARLLYVAMTRARDHLCIIAGDRPDKDGRFGPREGTWAGMLLGAAPPCLFADGPEPGGMPALYRYPDTPPAPLPPSPTEREGEEENTPPTALTPGPSPTGGRGEQAYSPPLAGGDEGEGEEENTPPAPQPPSPLEREGEEGEAASPSRYAGLAARLAPLPESPGVTFASPSGLGGERTRERDSDGAFFRETESAGLPSRNAVARGLLIHAALESFGRTGGYDLGGLAKRIPAVHALGRRDVSALVSGVENTLARLLADAEINRLLTPGPGKYFELPLLLRRGYTIIGGSADLVVVGGGRAAVVDYKTGLADMTLDEVREAYAPQLAAYRDAVSEAFGVEDVSACLLLVDRVELVRAVLP